jgi:histone acetyltransferase (RNA polymerase elongator complex component)
MTSFSPKPFIIPVFLPNIGCPHQCAFCNQKTITGIKSDLPSPKDLQKIIIEFLSYKGKSRGEAYIAFYGGNFLGLEPAQIEAMLLEASTFVEAGQVAGIRMSTRPDTITDETLSIISKYPVSTIELGVQSMQDSVLDASRRGHKASDTIEAVKRLKLVGYEIGLQMMVGLPEDNEARSIQSARAIADLFPDFVRIYPTVVLKNSLLAKWYKQGTYEPMNLDDCVTLVKEIYLLFKKEDIRVVRMGLQETEELVKDSSILAGPYHPAFGHLVHSEIFLDAAIKLIESDKLFGDSVILKVRPENISMMRGLKNKNVEILKDRYNYKSLDIVPDSMIDERQWVVIG